MTDSHEWSRGKALYILGSLEPVRITLLAQQTRALNLVYALACEGYLKAGTRIAVLGAGPAGLTAAQAAAHLGAEVQVFEQAAQPFSIFCPNGTGNNRRYVHPNLESWPEEGWSEPDAKLPFLNWSAGTPAEVIASYIKGLTKTSIGAAKERLKIFCSVQARIHPNAGRNWRSDGLNWRVEFRAKDWEWNQWNKQDPRPPVGGRWDAEILLLAIGFGEDGVNTTSSDESLPYWSSDAKLWARIEKVRHPKAVLVSGGGDGALIDAVNAALHAKDNPFPHRQLLERLRGLILTPSLRRGLIAIEQAIRKKRWSNELLWREYQELQVQHADELQTIDGTLGFIRAGIRRVIWATGDIRALRPNTFALNRFLAWRLMHNGRIEHVVGRLSSASAKRTSRPRTITLSDTPDEGVGRQQRITNVAEIIRRHGASKQIQQQYQRLFEHCKPSIESKNELDQTRIPAWPLNFFVQEPGKKLLSSPTPKPASTTMTKLVVKPPSPIAIDLVKADWTFSPMESAPAGEDDRCGLWTKLAATFELHFPDDVSNADELFLEHQLTPTHPFRLRLANPEKDHIFPKRLHGNPPWAVAYAVRPRKSKPITIFLEGDPCGAVWMPDAAGFPVYANMQVKRIELNIRFEGLKPFVRWKKKKAARWTQIDAAISRYQTPLRRLVYEDGETTDSLADVEIQKLNNNEDAFISSLSWSANRKRFLPLGYFYGVEWDGMVPVQPDDRNPATPRKG